MTDTDRKAFPQFDYGNRGAGMSLREYAAIKAMQGLLAFGAIYSGKADSAFLVLDAVIHADALLSELAKETLPK